MYSQDSTPTSRKHKKHKRDKYDDREYGTSSQPPSGNARLKLILKVGGSSTPEHSDSPGPAMSHVLNVPYDDDSNSALSYSQIRKAKKKEKKKKKDKKHKHHKEKRRREREEASMTSSILPISVVPIPMEADPAQEILEHEQDDVKPLTDISMDEEQTNQQQTPSTSAYINEIKPLQIVVPKLKYFDKIPLQKMLDHVLRLIQKKDSQQVFAWPVTDKIAPGYSSIISKPMDFSTMRSKVDRGEYNTLMEFKDDFVLMCNNAMRYNHVDTVYYKAAKKLLQSGCKILDPEKIRALLPVIPAISVLHEEQLGFPLFLDQENAVEISQSEEEDPTFLDPTKSIHYVPPHPNDPPDLCGAFADDLTPEEILRQARQAARDAAHRLATKKPNSKMGFLRQKDDGSTSLAIITPSNGVLPGTREQPVSLGLLTGKLTHGTTQVQGYRGEDKKNHSRTSKPLNYGAFSSFAPSHDSTFAGLTPDEQELVQATYGDDTAVQYADSILEFSKGCDYAMRMVDEILDTLTKGEHSRTVSLIEERKKMDEEVEALRKKQETYEKSIQEEWKFVESMGLSEAKENDGNIASTSSIDFDSLKSLQNDLGIDTKFIEDLKPTIIVSSSESSSACGKLEETAQLIENLEKLQNERLNQPTLPVPPYVQPPTENEVKLAGRVTENLIHLVKQTVPASISSSAALHKAMGIDLNAAKYKPPKTGHGETSKTGELLGILQGSTGTPLEQIDEQMMMLLEETPDPEMEVEV